ncbi:DUF5977 domain-containing protein [Pedobacter sp. PF22-3]|uniref:DUF5977 domain-containing protein n=1 Tax=Pedobacter sp. PF22-3 TaxID=2994467 RepID=UPI0022462276|nr:DUF5977 domain-containing protein [Pedobacter sp. PF22-3]MCX2494295.1 DUF5977 domain-containing protein [Pedobacter sp. PF22-3]
MRFLNALTIAVAILVAQKSFAQLQPQFPINMPSANAANLGMYMEVPVSKYTGIPSISIPLYTIADGNLKIPVELSYHAGGVKVDNHPGWVGLGWSLRAGGCITRIVKGLEDELQSDLGGFYDNYASIADVDWYTPDKLKTKADNNSDASPDEFSFSAGGISGTFLLDHQGNWQVRCDRDVKVIFNSTDFIAPFVTTAPPNTNGISNYHRNFGKFTLVTGDGTKYIFGGTNDAIDYSLDFFSQNSTQWTATSWYLTQVISADAKHNINLVYERDQYTNVLYWSKFQNYSNIQLTNNQVCTSAAITDRTSASLSGNLIAPVYLKSIETTNEYLQFERSTTTELRYSNSIYGSTYAVYDKVRSNSAASQQQTFQTDAERQASIDTTLYKFMPYLRQNGLTAYPGILNNLQWKKLDKFTLKDKYNNQVIKQFSFNYTNDNNKRLTLLSLKESNPTATIADTLPPYRFYYEDTYPLGSYLNKYVDDWGYRTSPSSVSDDIGSPRLVDPAYCTTATLRRIVYPTGGYKLFFFESNSYSSAVNDANKSLQNKNRIGGGLRVKSIFDYDPLSKKVKGIKYFYLKNFTSPNQLVKLSSGVIKNEPEHYRIFTDTLPSGEIFTSSLKSQNSVIPMSENAEGSPIGYSEVAEVYADNSYVVSKYTNYDDGHLDENVLGTLFYQKSLTNNFSSLALERGKLKYSALFNSNGTKLKSTTITYQPLRNNRTYVRQSDSKKYQVCNYGVANASLSGPYVYEGGSYKFYTYPYVPVTAVDSLFDGLAPVVKTVNYYYDNPLNKLLTRTEVIKTDGKKTTDLTLYPQDYLSGTGFIDQMLVNYIIEQPIENVRYVTDPTTGGTRIISGKIQTYDSTNPLLKVADFQMESLTALDLANFKFSGSAAGSLPYNTGKGAFNVDQHYKNIANYTYNLTYANLIQSDLINGTSSSVIWGYNNRLPIAKVVNAAASEIYFNSFEEDPSNVSSDSKTGFKSKLLNGASYTLPVMPNLSGGRKYLLSFWYKNAGGSWTYSATSYATLPSSIGGYQLIDELRIHPETAKMVTTSYVSSRGQLSAEADAASRSKSYEYDAMLRLKTVRDDKRNILEQYNYNFAPITTNPEIFYYNVVKTGSYQKNNCATGTGTIIPYAVGAGSYVSATSQSDADNQAQNEVSANGQANANLLGQCVYYNVAQQGTFYRSNCVSPQVAAPFVVSVAAGKYSSETSQADADAQAASYISSQGAAVNALGSCFLPTISVNVANNQNTTSTILVKFTKTGSSTSYSTTAIAKGTSGSFSVPPGQYNITVTTTGPIGSIKIYRNNSFQNCNPSSWGTVTVGSSGNESFNFTMSNDTCSTPPPLD